MLSKYNLIHCGITMPSIKMIILCGIVNITLKQKTVQQSPTQAMQENIIVEGGEECPTSHNLQHLVS